MIERYRLLLCFKTEKTVEERDRKQMRRWKEKKEDYGDEMKKKKSERLKKRLKEREKGNISK